LIITREKKEKEKLLEETDGVEKENSESFLLTIIKKLLRNVSD